MTSNKLVVLNCDGWGACCTGMGHPQFYRAEIGEYVDERWAALPEELKDQVNEHIDNLTDIDLGEPCIWYDPVAKGCMHYEYRPQMGRDFEVNSPGCHAVRARKGIV